MIEKYHETDPMSDVISDDYRMLQMISRFGITLGFGDKTVAETCREAGVHVTTFLTLVNYLKGHAHINEMVERISLPSLIQYLKNSHTYFVDFRMPALRRKLIEAIDCSSPGQIAFLILKFYDEYAAEVARHMEYENTYVHPHVETLLAGRLPAERYEEVVNRHGAGHASIEKSITELKSIIIKYYPNDSNAQLLNDVLMDIYMVEEDLLTHCRMEDELFYACVRRLEDELRLNGSPHVEEQAEDTAYARTGADGLSEREKEVIAHVAKGLSNKEIAERMFISVNTVMTHRRNISRKLDIRTASGLTIYAIVNGLISLEDVKM